MNLEELEFGNKFNQEIKKDTLPTSLIILKFGENFNNNGKKINDIFYKLVNLELLVLPEKLKSNFIKTVATIDYKKYL